jgi:hypothetical protein
VRHPSAVPEARHPEVELAPATSISNGLSSQWPTTRGIVPCAYILPSSGNSRRVIGEIIRWEFEFCNTLRPHSSLDRKTPDQVYFNFPLPMPKAA